jgi:hypothetical protein
MPSPLTDWRSGKPLAEPKPVYVIDNRIFAALPHEQAKALHWGLYEGGLAHLGDRLVRSGIGYVVAGEIDRQVRAGHGDAKALIALAMNGAAAELLEAIINTHGATARRDAAARASEAAK